MAFMQHCITHPFTAYFVTLLFVAQRHFKTLCGHSRTLLQCSFLLIATVMMLNNIRLMCKYFF